MKKFQVKGTGVKDEFKNLTLDNIDCDVEAVLMDFMNESDINETMIIKRVE